MTKYENNFDVTEALYVEVIKKMIPAARYVMYTVAFIFLAVSAYVMILGKNYPMGIIWFVLSAFLCFAGYFGIPMKARKIFKQRFPSLCDKNGVFWKKTTFGEKDFLVTEPTTSARFKYSEIGGVSETKHLYVIFLRDKRFTFLKKGCFTDATDGEFIDFLKEKCNAK
ncbi:MAG: YcxB family protein [Clostridia bacterium]|nr:YcxB family protein [Clostridia bacterium]